MKPLNARKKPVVIEVMQFDGTEECGRRIVAWVTGHGGVMALHYAGEGGAFSGLRGETIDGNQYPVDAGTWVMKGVALDFYPCQPHIFEATYDLVGDAT